MIDAVNKSRPLEALPYNVTDQGMSSMKSLGLRLIPMVGPRANYVHDNFSGRYAAGHIFQGGRH